MTRHISVLLSLLVWAALAGGAWALTPEQVVIVANADEPQSVAVAAYYAQQRQIDPSQIVALHTTGEYQISHEDYQTQIVQPLRAALLERGLAERTKCLVLTWGMPVHVLAAKDPVAGLLAAEATKAHYRLAVDYKLLSTVGRKFPPPRTTGLEPLADLFESPTPAVPEPLPEWAALLKDILAMLDMKQRELSATQPGESKEIAARQLMALCLEIRGQEGLVEFLRQTGLADSPLAGAFGAELDAARIRLRELHAGPPGEENARAILAALQQTGGVVAVGAYCQDLKPSDSILRGGDAAVDSELAMLWGEGYPLTRQLANPLSWRFRRSEWAGPADPPAVLMTARLDGPSPDDAMRIIRDSVETEKTGLKGTFYIDAGGPDRAKQYDQVLVELCRFIKGSTTLDAVLDESPEVFAPGTCPHAALYVGWYSLQKYVPAFTWVPGSVGWHVASWEAMHLRDPSSPEWCPQMIRAGIAATIGAVEEPTLGGLPLPQEFFALLLTGRYTVAECYWRVTPVVSWRVLLIGDPLYTPFKADPRLALAVLPAELVPPPDWPPAYLPAGATTASAPTSATATSASAPATGPASASALAP